MDNIGLSGIKAQNCITIPQKTTWADIGCHKIIITCFSLDLITDIIIAHYTPCI